MNQEEFDIVYKQKLLDTFKFLIDFLNKKDLRWWAAYGTIIGAVRHHGLIPWDDDIDIWMPRCDYEKLISMHKEFFDCSQGRYVIDHITINSSYHAKFAKVMDINTTIQTKKFIPFVKGVFIDVFPLDSSNDNVQAILCTKNRMQKAWKEYFQYDWHYSFSDVVDAGFSIGLIIKVLKTNIKKDSKAKYNALEKALTIEKEISKDSYEGSRNCFSIFGFYNERDIFNPDWFSDYTEMLFEGFMIRIPIGYDELLTQIYGDYMTPPPVDKRIPRHKPYYINLNERLTLEEIAQRVKAGETIVY